MEEVIRSSITSYQELNGDVIDELHETNISPLAFMRYVHKNRPFVIRGGCSEWSAVRKWTTPYLRGLVGDAYITVAVTPHGSV